MKDIFFIAILFTLVSCGGGARLDGVELSAIGGNATTNAVKGTIVGSVNVKGVGCTIKEYKLKNDYNGYFEVNSNGEVILGKDHPEARTYELVVTGGCDNQDSTISFNITISPVATSGIFIPSIPWLTQVGSVTGGVFSSEEQACGGADTIRAGGVAVDELGNVYCAGLTINPLAKGAKTDIYILKLSAEGDLIWRKSFSGKTIPGGDASGDDFCNAITVDKLGNVYCAGSTTGSLGEGNGDGGKGNSDAFIIKLDTDGNFVWIKQLGQVTIPGGNSAASDACLGIDIDSTGNIYCAGYTSGSLGEGNGDGGKGGKDAFVMKLDSSGNLVWLKQFGDTTMTPEGKGATAYEESCFSVKVDQLGNVYCGGHTMGSIGENFGGGLAYGDAFVMKLDSSGNLVWLKQFGKITIGLGSGEDDYCASVNVDQLGNVYCAGATFGALGEANGNGKSEDAFVMKLDSSGNLTWIKQLGSITAVPGGKGATRWEDSLTGVDVDSSGNVYCSGYTSGGIGEANGGGIDAFVMKLNSSADITWIKQLGATSIVPGGDTSENDFCTGVTVDSLGNVYCGGYTTSDLGEASGTGAGAKFGDSFILKLNSNGQLL